MENKTITVQAIIHAPIEKVWECWITAEHVTQWNNASDDWHTPRAENDLKVGGKFLYRMEAKDGSSGFDFTGRYTNLKEHQLIEYDMDDGRHVQVEFLEHPGSIKIIETFEPESKNPEKVQRDGWQSILSNFKKYVEENG